MVDDSTKVFVYTYSDPLLESVPDLSVWAQEVVRRLAELGDSLEAVGNLLSQLEAFNVALVVLAELGLTLESDSQTQQFIQAKQPIQHSELLKLLQTVPAEHRSEQLRRSHARNRLKALPPPGRAPYGYRRGKDRYAIDRSTAPVVKDFFEHFLLYGSLRGSVRYLQKKYNKKISVSTGKRWLTSPVYRGDLEYQDGDVLRDTHMPILSRQEAAQVDRLLRRNRRMPSRTASAPRSLSGLVTCADCGSTMKISRTTHKQQEYLYLHPVSCSRQPRCSGLPYQQVLEQTIQQICAELPPAVDAAAIPDVDQIKQKLTEQLAAKQAILGQIPSLVDTEILDPETAALRTYKVQTEIAAIQTQFAQLPPVNLKATAQTVSIPQFWFDLSESERRFYFREFIRQIKILRTEQGWTIQLAFIF
jgi:DNA invertase Pin-like site-specific DNA recombinase